MRAYDYRRVLAVKALVENNKSTKIDKNKIINFIDGLLNASPENAYLLLENRKQKDRFDKLMQERENIGSNRVKIPKPIY